MFVIASLLSYVAVLWASWYLAALGYAFRYLQYGQHCIEQALGWDAYVPSFVMGSFPESPCRTSGKGEDGSDPTFFAAGAA